MEQHHVFRRRAAPAGCRGGAARRHHPAHARTRSADLSGVADGFARETATDGGRVGRRGGRSRPCAGRAQRAAGQDVALSHSRIGGPAQTRRGTPTRWTTPGNSRAGSPNRSGCCPSRRRSSSLLDDGRIRRPDTRMPRTAGRRPDHRAWNGRAASWRSGFGDWGTASTSIGVAEPYRLVLDGHTRRRPMISTDFRCRTTARSPLSTPATLARRTGAGHPRPARCRCGRSQGSPRSAGAGRVSGACASAFGDAGQPGRFDDPPDRGAAPARRRPDQRRTR